MQLTLEQGTRLELPTLLIFSVHGILLKVASVLLTVTWALCHIPLSAVLEEQ